MTTKASVTIDDRAKIAMTLAAIAYAKGRDAIVAQLANKDYATGGEWQLVWGPCLKESNQMYFVKHVTEELYAVAIRGSLTNFPSKAFFGNWYEDLDVLHQEKWPYPIGDEYRDAAIARGSAIGLDHLTKMTGDGSTLLDYIKNNVLPKGGNILVTGHSLGACLTTVFSLWLHYQLREVSGATNVKIVPYTFAAPSAGNQAFANFYNETFKESWRYYNTIDVVPKAWADVFSIKKLYGQPGPKCPEDIKLAVDSTEAALKATEWWDRSHYTQTNGLGSPLAGTPNPTSDFFAEIGDQHAANNYLRLLGAPAVNLPKPKQSPEKQIEHIAEASLDYLDDRVSNSNTYADKGKLALQVAIVARSVKTIVKEYYLIKQSPQKPIDIGHHVISGSALTFMHVCLLFATHYLIEYFKARPGVEKIEKIYQKADRNFQVFSSQEAQLSARLKNSGDNR